MVFQPSFHITSQMARDLARCEVALHEIAQFPTGGMALLTLSMKARIATTHYSTRIEGNRLSLRQVTALITQGTEPAGRERDVMEVRNLWEALDEVERWAGVGRSIDIGLIRELHGIIENGRRGRPTDFRDGQNVIHDSGSGAIIYLPPEAKDVQGLMEDLAAWVIKTKADGIPIPIVAGLVHYQFVTIHPFYDGNGRSARLLADLVLLSNGHLYADLSSLSEAHHRDLARYYGSLQAHQHHNYYEGRKSADLTAWLEYYCTLAADCAEEAARGVALITPLAETPEAIKGLDSRARRILPLFRDRNWVTSSDIAIVLGVSRRMARIRLDRWVSEGWLEVGDRNRRPIRFHLRNDVVEALA